MDLYMWIQDGRGRREEGELREDKEREREREKKGASPVQYDQEEAESSPKYHF